MSPKFGTSGLRGLAEDLTDEVVAAHTSAFLSVCNPGNGLYVGRDLRHSSRRISECVIATARAAGVPVHEAGVVPTPALALASGSAGAAAMMITGSHIPADRNGLKFYTPHGEITKADEAAITAALATPLDRSESLAPLHPAPQVGRAYVSRFTSAYGAEALGGLHLGLWSHSAAGRDLVAEGLAALGARVTELDREDHFVPVDTEAVDDATRRRLAGWATSYGLDAIVSTDGDGDRPLLTDASGAMIPGDILGQITAQALGASHVATPVSSNSGAEHRFEAVIRTRIGSPYVVEAMAAAQPAKVAGYEANGGFLLGFEAQGPAGPLPPLMTRDSLLPIIATLHAARETGLAARVAREPARFTAANRLAGRNRAAMNALLTDLSDPVARARLLDAIAASPESRIDTTDGARMTLSDGAILHLRPSGNAPELRVYAEAATVPAAQALCAAALAHLDSRVPTAS